MRRLILFARRPVLGRVKTRLAATMGPRSTLALYEAFVADQVGWLRGFADRCALELCLDDTVETEPPPTLDLHGVACTPQGPGDLGRRLLRAFRRAAEGGAAATVVVGADAPTLPAERVDAAFAALEAAADVALAAADDGGYVLIGARRPHAVLFERIAWGTEHVGAATRARAVAAGLRLAEIPGWYDIDDAAGLARLRVELSEAGAAARAPRTARLLADLDLGKGRVV